MGVWIRYSPAPEPFCDNLTIFFFPVEKIAGIVYIVATLDENRTAEFFVDFAGSFLHLKVAGDFKAF